MSEPSTTRAASTRSLSVGRREPEAQGEAPPILRRARRAPRRRITVTLTLMPGSEPWVNVSHPTGMFRVPGDVSVLDVVQLAMDGARSKPMTKAATPQARVSLGLLFKLLEGPTWDEQRLSTEHQDEVRRIIHHHRP